MRASTWRMNTTIYPRQWQHYTAAPVRANQNGRAIRPIYSHKAVFRCLLRKPTYISETSLTQAWCGVVASLNGILCTRLGSIGYTIVTSRLISTGKKEWIIRKSAFNSPFYLRKRTLSSLSFLSWPLLYSQQVQLLHRAILQSQM